jgi:hypothetical protein
MDSRSVMLVSVKSSPRIQSKEGNAQEPQGTTAHQSKCGKEISEKQRHQFWISLLNSER